MKTNVLILAAGKERYNSDDAGYPFYLTEFEGVSLLERVFLNTNNIKNANYSFVFLDEHIKKYHLDKIATLLSSESTIVKIPNSPKGSACTALLAASQLDQNGELLIISANEVVNVNLHEIINEFRSKQFTAGTLVFHSIHPRYSYARLNDQSLVTEVAQKNPISDHATTGIFWYKKTSDFVDGAKNMIRKNASTDGDFFIAPVFNELILKQCKIGIHRIKNNQYTPLKSDRHIKNLEVDKL